MSSSWKKDEPPETQWVRLPSKRDGQAALGGEPAPQARRRPGPGQRSPDAPPNADSPFAHHQRDPTGTMRRRQEHSKRSWVLMLIAVLLGALAIAGGMVLVEQFSEPAPEVVG